MSFTDKAGESTDQPVEIGSVMEQTMDPHLPANAGKGPFEVVLVEVKPKGR